MRRHVVSSRHIVVVVSAVTERSLEAVPSAMRCYPVGEAVQVACVPSVPTWCAGRRAIWPAVRDAVAECGALPGLGALSLRSE